MTPSAPMERDAAMESAGRSAGPQVRPPDPRLASALASWQAGTGGAAAIKGNLGTPGESLKVWVSSGMPNSQPNVLSYCRILLMLFQHCAYIAF